MAPDPSPSATLDEFDAILAAGGSSPGATASAPPSAPPAATTTSTEHRADAFASTGVAVESRRAPDLADFVSGWGLYRDPVLCGVLAGVGLSALGVFVVLRRAVFVTATLSQAAGLGVALAFYAQIHLALNVSPVLGALVMSILATLLVAARPPVRMARETVVGFAFVGTSALAVLVGDRIAQEAHDIAAILFGTAVLVRPEDFWLVTIGTGVSLVVLFVLRRALTFTGFDPEGAKVQGLPVKAIEASFWTLFAVEVSIATRALGSLPVFAFAVLPAASGLMLANRLRAAFTIAIVAGALAGGVGYVLAFLAELPVGASQAATATAIAVIAYGASRLRR